MSIFFVKCQIQRPNFLWSIKYVKVNRAVSGFFFNHSKFKHTIDAFLIAQFAETYRLDVVYCFKHYRLKATTFYFFLHRGLQSMQPFGVNVRVFQRGNGPPSKICSALKIFPNINGFCASMANPLYGNGNLSKCSVNISQMFT